MDLDLNGTVDVEETLVDNGQISSDLLAWETRISDPGYGRFVRDDANSFACSGAMELWTLEAAVTIAPALFTWTINYAQQCIPTTASSVIAIGQARLVANTGDYSRVLDDIGTDPAYASVDLSTFGSADCAGESLAQSSTQVELATSGSWQLLSGALTSVSPVQSVLVRWNVVPDDLAGQQPTGVRVVHWDNLMVKPL